MNFVFAPDVRCRHTWFKESIACRRNLSAHGSNFMRHHYVTLFVQFSFQCEQQRDELRKKLVHMFLSRHQNWGNIKIPNHASENVTKFTLLKATVFNQNYIHEEIKKLTTMSARTKAFKPIVFGFSNTWIRGSNFTLDTDVCQWFVYVFVLCR
jgi:hypothetical protein